MVLAGLAPSSQTVGSIKRIVGATFGGSYTTLGGSYSTLGSSYNAPNIAYSSTMRLTQ